MSDSEYPQVERRKNPVEARVVGATPGAKPIPAEIVSDKRNLFGRRLGMLGVGLLILFFAASGYIQSAQNGRLLREATADRAELIMALNKANTLLGTQQRRIAELEAAIREQNRILRQAGLPTVTPGVFPSPTPGTRFTPTVLPRSDSSPSPTSSESASPRPTPSSSPSPSPTPSPTPSDPVEQIVDFVCRTTGVCI